MARDRFKNNEPKEVELELISCKAANGRSNNVGPSNEVGALIVGDLEDSCGTRDIVVQIKTKQLQRIFETNAHFMPLQYPLLFPYGDEGFQLKIPLMGKNGGPPPKVIEGDDDGEESKQRCYVSMGEYYAYKLMIRLTEVEQYRLEWIKQNQKTIQSDLYNSILDSLRKGDSDTTWQGNNVILPATFTCSRRYMSQYFKDSLSICRSIGHPSFFLTMTCNTKWPEIQSILQHMTDVNVADAPDVVARVFKMKLDQLVDLIKNQNYFGRCTERFFVFSVYVGWKMRSSFPKECHMNLEICNNYRSLKYLFKYYLKGHDTTIMMIRRKKGLPLNSEKVKTIDEVRHFLDEGGRNVTFNVNDTLEEVATKASNRKSKLEAWFVANKTIPGARDYTYQEFPRGFSWLPGHSKWKQCERGIVIERLTEVHASQGDTFFFRMLLLRNKGVTSFRDLRTINGRTYNTYKEACEVLGLLKDDNQ
ncbi:uncharacterized protein LOC141660692 [Apium graveolens]|uniref:uncharacterized protein LOC141660692 n=1 Tax=Apium graveolens TaxID=4045 RepID=UPI003D7B74FD